MFFPAEFLIDETMIVIIEKLFLFYRSHDILTPDCFLVFQQNRNNTEGNTGAEQEDGNRTLGQNTTQHWKDWFCRSE